MISEKQKKILAFRYSKYDMLVCSGAIRSGKSSLMTVSFIDDCMERFDGQLFGICGKTIGNAKKNVYTPWANMTRTRGRYVVKPNFGDNTFSVTRGGVTNHFELFGGKDERSQDLIQGRTLAGVLLDEAVLMPQSFVNQAMARCSVEGSRIWLNCNPGSPEHWLYKEIILRADELNALVLDFELRDNPSLSEKVIQRYESMYRGVFHDRYVKGKWVLAEGLVYQFEKSDYMLPAEEIAEVTNPESHEHKPGRWHVSMDYGITNPFAALLWYVTNDRAYVVDEYYYDSGVDRPRTDAEHLDAVESLAGDRTVAEVVIDPSASSFKAEMYRRGKWAFDNADNSVNDGIALTTQMIADGSIKISDACENLIREMGLYRWDDKSRKDAVIKENDHACDAMRYEAYTMLVNELKSYR